jgi:hypothetical protein
MICLSAFRKLLLLRQTRDGGAPNLYRSLKTLNRVRLKALALAFPRFLYVQTLLEVLATNPFYLLKRAQARIEIHNLGYVVGFLLAGLHNAVYKPSSLGETLTSQVVTVLVV